jgi:hypothetical protein
MAKQYYIYIPYSNQESNDELVEGARGWRRSYASYAQGLDSPEVRAKLPKPALIHGSTATPLSVLDGLDPESYVVYIMAHGNIGRPSIANTRLIGVRGRIMMTAQELSNRLLSDGLPRTVRHLKLYACLAGALGGGNAGSALDSFGARLYWSLITRGCDNVQLSAYTMALNAIVDSSTGHKQTNTGSRPSACRRRWP